MSPNSVHDLPLSHIVDPNYRKEAAPQQKPREVKPLLTREPLPHGRERKPEPQPQKKRKRAMPTSPPLAYDARQRQIPCGRQDSPVSPSVCSGPSASESSESSYDEQQPTPFPDREIHGQVHNGYDAQKRPRIFPECSSTERSTLYFPDATHIDVHDMNSVPQPDFYDSPASCTSSSSPAPSDQSPCAAQVVGFTRPVYPVCVYDDEGQVYVQQPVVHEDPYGYQTDPYADRLAQGYPMQYPDPAYGRPAPHGVPAYLDNSSYPYPPRRY